MKKLFSYLESLTPTLTDNQRKHIEMLVKDMVGNESQIQYGNGYRDGRTVGRREGEREQSIISLGGGRAY